MYEPFFLCNRTFEQWDLCVILNRTVFTKHGGPLHVPGHNTFTGLLHQPSGGRVDRTFLFVRAVVDKDMAIESVTLPLGL